SLRTNRQVRFVAALSAAIVSLSACFDASTRAVAGPADSCPCSLWTDTNLPATVENDDPNRVELGVRFRSDVAGSIAAIRFYKGTGNDGPHAGHLWTASGTLLGTIWFAGETVSGLQVA